MKQRIEVHYDHAARRWEPRKFVNSQTPIELATTKHGAPLDRGWATINVRPEPPGAQGLRASSQGAG